MHWIAIGLDFGQFREQFLRMNGNGNLIKTAKRQNSKNVRISCDSLENFHGCREAAREAEQQMNYTHSSVTASISFFFEISSPLIRIHADIEDCTIAIVQNGSLRYEK